MRKEIYSYIVAKKDLHRFIREQPIWYKILSRDPSKLQECERRALIYFEKTIPHRVQKVANNIQMASMLVNMLYAMNQK